MFSAKGKSTAYSLLLYAILLACIPSMALADNGNAVANTFCNIIGMCSGQLGHAIESVSLIVFGVMILQGKISLEKSLLEVVGGALVVGAGSIVIALGGSGACI